MSSIHRAPDKIKVMLDSNEAKSKMENHQTVIASLCRVCRNRAQNRKDIRQRIKPILATQFIDDIYILYGIDISADTIDKHATKLCKVCVQQLRHSKQSGKNNELTLNGKYAQCKERSEHENFWREHGDNCEVCEHSIKLSKGFTKHVDTGRPKQKEHNLMFNVYTDNIFSHLFEPSFQSPRLDNCHLPMVEYKKCNFICSVCKDILPLCSVRTGCHYYCSHCMSDIFKSARQNCVQCPDCMKNVAFDKVTAIDTQFRNILCNLEVQCSKCNLTGDYTDLLVHNCDASCPAPGDQSTPADEHNKQTHTSMEVDHATDITLVNDQHMTSTTSAQDQHMMSIKSAEDQHVTSITPAEGQLITSITSAKDQSTTSVISAEDQHITPTISANYPYITSILLGKDQNTASIASAEYLHMTSMTSAQDQHMTSISSAECITVPEDQRKTTSFTLAEFQHATTPSTSAENQHATSSRSDEDQPTTPSTSFSQASYCTLNKINIDDHDHKSYVIISLNKKGPLSKKEEKACTSLIKRKMEEEGGDVIKCKTGGQPICLVKVRKARKESSFVRTPLKRKRNGEINKVRADVVAGKSGTFAQKSSELKELKCTEFDKNQQKGVGSS